MGVWKKAGRCNASIDCVEVQFTSAQRCESDACVQVGDGGDQVLVRDSKDAAGPVLTFTRSEWDVFVAGVKDGDFDFKG